MFPKCDCKRSAKMEIEQTSGKKELASCDLYNNVYFLEL